MVKDGRAWKTKTRKKSWRKTERVRRESEERE